ncbi:acyl-CoA dehydrogenase family protein [Burkholderia sp. BCC0405]|uniref:acyl-CoA dehydrogenase family protein n=1 Tax=Burkholderia sp. BCC0405 TaxID=2676298 RepID=UPI001FC89B23|nr:acyl-CoA dehydrogenase family protein [Burkholderia sp. BCC0405]
MLTDEAHRQLGAPRRESADALVGRLTQVVKAFFIDNGCHGADEALQVWGSYVHEYGMEQAVRDNCIAMIYEGKNEIQTIDLLQRKVLDDVAVRLDSMLALLNADAMTAPRRPPPSLRRRCERRTAPRAPPPRPCSTAARPTRSGCWPVPSVLRCRPGPGCAVSLPHAGES